MEALKLIGVLIVVLGFLFKRDTIATVIVAGIATGLVAGMSPLALLNLLGKAFTDQRVATLFVLTLPVVGLLERYGLKEKAVDLIASIKRATAGKILALYHTIRAVAVAFSVPLGGHPSFVRPLIAPMAEGAAVAKLGDIDDKTRDRVRADAAATDNIGNFFAQNLFLGAPGVLLIVSTMAEQGYEVTALKVAMWSLPVAAAALLMGYLKHYLTDRSLRVAHPTAAATTEEAAR